MAPPRAQVRNAADPKQVRRAERIERDEAALFVEAARQTLRTPFGRMFVWGLIERLGVYESCFDTHGSLQSYRCGRQDAGHELVAVSLAAGDDGHEGPTLYEVMEREARQRKRLAERATDASHTARAEQAGEQTDDRSS